MRKALLLGVLLASGAAGCLRANATLVDPMMSRYRIETAGGPDDEGEHLKRFFTKAKQLCPNGFKRSNVRYIGREGARGYVQCKENML